MHYETKTLPSGLRIILEQSASDVVYTGYVVAAGTRYEDEADHGMAHFIEHMTFKGTERRTARQINQYLEEVGGELNAFTSKQEVVYHASVLRPHLRRALDLLSDIVFRSTFPDREMRREIEVICDEIESYRDTPSELIFDEFENWLFASTPLGRDILGHAERLRQYTPADARRFVSAHYKPSSCALYVLGNVEMRQVLAALPAFLKSEELGVRSEEWAGAQKCEPNGNSSFLTPHSSLQPTAEKRRIVEKQTHQAHVMLGAQSFGTLDERRYTHTLLNNLLGGPGMNSRLNIAVRERAGLVYTIDSFYNAYPDAGYWCVYFGCDKADVRKAERLVHRELERLATKPLSAHALRVAKAQLIGQIALSCDRRESYAIALGKQYAKYGTHRDVQALYRGIEAVSADDLQALAAEIYDPSRIHTLVYA